MIAIQTSERNGAVVAALPVKEDDEVMLITDAGTLIRTPVATISVLGRNTQGVTLIGLGKEELLVGMALVEAGDMDDEPEGAENESSNEAGSADDQDSSASSVDQSDGDNE